MIVVRSLGLLSAGRRARKALGPVQPPRPGIGRGPFRLRKRHRRRPFSENLPSPPESPRLLWVTRRRFDPSSSPSASLPRLCVLRANSRAIRPSNSSVFHLGSGLPIDRAGILFSGRPFLSEALDSTHSVQFSIIEPLELLMNFIGKRFGRFCRTCEKSDF